MILFKDLNHLVQYSERIQNIKMLDRSRFFFFFFERAPEKEIIVSIKVYYHFYYLNVVLFLLFVLNTTSCVVVGMMGHVLWVYTVLYLNLHVNLEYIRSAFILFYTFNFP